MAYGKKKNKEKVREKKESGRERKKMT